jgi:DNA-binding response OmpR family regulator
LITSGSAAYYEDIPKGEIVHRHSGRRVLLTPSELCIYRILSANRGHVIGSQRLTNYYTRWFSHEASIYADDTLARVMIQSIRHKVGADCIETIKGHGYVIQEEHGHG